MLKKKLLILTSMLLAIFIFSPGFSNTFAQEGQDIEMKAKEGAASKGNAADPNIKEDLKPNSKGSKADPPPKKGGMSKGAGCEVQIDNWTQWKIKIYVDGVFRGIQSPFGESYTYAIPGRVKVYARADFDDGSYLYWGPRDYSCRPGEYIYFKITD